MSTNDPSHELRKNGRLLLPFRALTLGGVALAGLGLCGCAMYDDVTSSNFSLKKYFFKPDPLVVLRDSHDGDERAEALRSLREPLQDRGSQADQDAVLKILTAAATRDSKPLCRLAAIQSLGHFKDPRAVQALIAAHDLAPRSFPAETATIIQCQALTGLGKTGNAEAVELLALVAREPQPAPEISEQEKQQARDRKIAAVRALGNFNHYQATEALLRVLQSERDVALRDRAHESLEQATGKRLPAEPKAWAEFLHRSAGAQPSDAELVRFRREGGP